MDRQKLFDEIANGFLAQYNKIRTLGLDAGLKGTASENILREWIDHWLPKRMSLKNGAVISITDGPTDQMDCLLFDSFESPVFHNIGGVEILPIEGVYGGIEINFGESTAYTKIKKDCTKLSRLAELSTNRIRRVPLVFSHIPGNIINTYNVQQAIDSLAYHVAHSTSKPLLLIFAEQINGTLKEAAERIMIHNKQVGIPKSIDGLFVLKLGFALHVAQNNAGWNTSRMHGDRFVILETNEGNVLSRFQNIILGNLCNYGKTYPGLDQYISVTGQAAKEMAEFTEISDQEYRNQPDHENVVPIAG
jgi:hypothetical protein